MTSSSAPQWLSLRAGGSAPGSCEPTLSDGARRSVLLFAQRKSLRTQPDFASVQCSRLPLDWPAASIVLQRMPSHSPSGRRRSKTGSVSDNVTPDPNIYPYGYPGPTRMDLRDQEAAAYLRRDTDWSSADDSAGQEWLAKQAAARRVRDIAWEEWERATTLQLADITCSVERVVRLVAALRSVDGPFPAAWGRLFLTEIGREKRALPNLMHAPRGIAKLSWSGSWEPWLRHPPRERFSGRCGGRCAALQ